MGTSGADLEELQSSVIPESRRSEECSLRALQKASFPTSGLAVRMIKRLVPNKDKDRVQLIPSYKDARTQFIHFHV